jgi:hypothetical protein
LFDEHIVDEASYKRKLEAYPKLVYASPSIIPKNNFVELDMD